MTKTEAIKKLNRYLNSMDITISQLETERLMEFLTQKLEMKGPYMFPGIPQAMEMADDEGWVI